MSNTVDTDVPSLDLRANRKTQMPPHNSVLVVIPTYNERLNLFPIIDRVLRATPDADILVVDDDSPDGTGRVAAQLAKQETRLNVLHRSAKGGLAQAYVSGFRWGIEAGYDKLVAMDADGSHHPEALPWMLYLSQHSDIVLGSRWVDGGVVENWPKRREALSRAGNLYARVALGISVRDATGGFRVYDAAIFRKIDLGNVSARGYIFQLDLVWRALQEGFRVTETPITFTERVVGESKMSGAIVRESILYVTRWGFQRRCKSLRAKLLGEPFPSVKTNSFVVSPVHFSEPEYFRSTPRVSG